MALPCRGAGGLTLDDLAAKLALLAVPAGVDVSGRGESEEVVVPRGDLHKGLSLEALERDRLELAQVRANRAAEAEDTL